MWRLRRIKLREIGIGYRHELADWLATRPSCVRSLEVTAEHFFSTDVRGQEVLSELSGQYQIAVHGLGLSLGTPGPLCQSTLEKFAWVADQAEAAWVSEHVSFSRTAEVDLGHLNPIPFTEDSLRTMIDHAIELSEYCGRPVVLENITSSLTVGGAMSETEFLNRLCEQAKCGLLLDVTNLFINSKNHSYDPFAWFRELDRSLIKQLHVVGYSQSGGQYHDHHSAPIQEDLMELISAVVEYSNVQFVTLERDDRLDQIGEIESELRRLEQVLGGS